MDAAFPPALADSQTLTLNSILARMYARRQREFDTERANLTLSYAVSVASGVCYVGYNDRSFAEDTGRSLRWQSATQFDGRVLYNPKLTGKQNACAEANALSIALSWGEKLENLVFLAMNKEGEPFQPCDTCQGWIRNAKGAFYKSDGTWHLHTSSPITEQEWTVLQDAGRRSAAEDQQWYAEHVSFGSVGPRPGWT